MKYTLRMRIAERPYVALLTAGLVLHGGILTYMTVRHGGIDAHAFRSPDAGEYYAIARNLALHGAFSQDAAPPFSPDTWRTPGYPLFLAALMVFLGDAPSTLVLVQHLLALANTLLFLAAAHLLLPRRALLAALIFLLEPYHLLYAGWLLSTTLQVTLLLLTWLTWQEAIRVRAGGWFLLSGLFVGALVLVWPGYLPLVVLLLAAVWFVRWRINFRARLSRHEVRISPFGPVVFALALLVVVMPWLARSEALGGGWQLSAQSGVVLAYFKAAEVTLWRHGGAKDRYLALSTDPAHAEFPHATWDAIDRELRLRLVDVDEDVRSDIHWSRLAQGNRTRVDSFRLSRELTDIATQHLLASPWATFSCYLVRIADQLTFPLSLTLFPPAGITSNPVKNIAMAAPYALLSLGVIFRLLHGRFDWMQVTLPLLVIVATLFVAAPQIDPRFRVPIVPFMLVVALWPRQEASTPRRLP